MMKYLLAYPLILITLSACGQYNKAKRSISDTQFADSIETINGGRRNIREPEFPGGMKAFMKFLNKKIRIPRDARKQKIKGVVFVEFVIDTLGEVKMESVKVVKSLMESCDKEAVRVILKLPRWIPATDLNTNEKIEVLYKVPIRFVSR